MPLRGGLRLSVIATTCAAALAAAGTARANDVVMWTCHLPDGTPLTTAPFGGSQVFAAGCANASTTLEAGGLEATPGSSLNLGVPQNVTLEQVQMTRSATLGEGGSYATTFTTSGPATTLESSSANVPAGDVTLPVTATEPAGTVTISASGTGSKADVQRLGIKVSDTAKPYAVVGVGGDVANNPKAEDPRVPIEVRATDVGAGLQRAEAWIDGQLAAVGTYGDGSCKDLTPNDAQVDLRWGANCPLSDVITLRFDSTLYPDGPHRLDVKVFDIAGNEFDSPLDGLGPNHTFTITNHPVTCGNPCDRPLNIGSGSTPQQNGSGNNNNNNGSGGVAGVSATSCPSPKLSMELSQKPLRISHGVPVLKYGKRYRFRGRLTCVVNHKRVSAAKSTRIDLLNKVGKKTVTKGGTTVRHSGRITIILAYKSSRTLTFRYTNPDGKRSQVKIRIKVAKH
jgi:hypothetical protein